MKQYYRNLIKELLPEITSEMNLREIYMLILKLRSKERH